MSQRSSLEDSNGITKPLPRRTFELSTPSTVSSSPSLEPQGFRQSAGQSPTQPADGSSTPQRTRSILNLTSSTLFGIYRDTDYATDKEEPSTPWGTGAESPASGRGITLDSLRSSIPDAFARNSNKKGAVERKAPSVTKRRSHSIKKGIRGYWLPLLANTTALFVAGVLYGMLVSRLHDHNDIAPVKVEGIDHSAWQYLLFWGIAGILLGHALPYVDELWQPRQDGAFANQRPKADQRRGSGAWNDVVRSIGAFVGIAFAIRKVSWQSTIQLSLTLALVNPCLWYLIDRTAPGFIVSTAFALTGTALLLGISPDLVPAPSTAHHLPSHIVKRMGQQSTIFPPPGQQDLPVFGIFSEESLAVATWIASVLFVSSVCFGNIGRKLAEARS